MKYEEYAKHYNPLKDIEVDGKVKSLRRNIAVNFIGALLVGLFICIVFFMGYVAGQHDAKLNNTWNKCQQKFKDSGAPMEARDSMMRDCFSK